jgi:hypothetical protein
VELYESEGFTNEDAKTVIDLISKHPKKFIDLMMVDELQLMPPSTTDPPAVAPFAAVGFVGTAVGALLFAQCAAAGFAASEVNRGMIFAGLFCAAAVAGACEALVRFKGASCLRVLASGLFFALCLGVATAAILWLGTQMR